MRPPPARAVARAFASGAAGATRSPRRTAGPPSRTRHPPRGPGRHHRLLGGRQVDGDGRLRGRGLLLRRQPAARDDPRRSSSSSSTRARRSSAPPSSPTSAAATTSSALRAVLEELESSGVRHRVLFLDADDDAILTRFQETRRRHPLAGASSVERGIAAERAVARAAQGAAPTSSSTPRAEGAHAAPPDRRRVPPARRLQARRLAGVLRLQARPRARRRPGLRRPLPAQPALRARAAPADGPRPDGSSTTSSRDGQLEDFYERLEPLLDFLLPAVRRPRARPT